MKKIFVALSGGVDSAVTAHILKSEGYAITGVFIRVWEPDFLPCNQDEEERAAKRVAAHLGIPFKRLNLSAEYKKDVVDTMIHEYKKGRTPNPDVLCNATIKFGAFLEYALGQGADKIATGHHARILPLSTLKQKCSAPSATFLLARGVDTEKDQAYFLWKLTQKELSKTLMPIGSMLKSEVRAYAEKYNIPSAHKPDSQGLCFIGHINMKTFLKNFINTREGKVINETGDIIGTHNGSELITIGQRSGFTITTKDANRSIQYVVEKDTNNNTITVSKEKTPESIATVTHTLIHTNWSQNVQIDEKYNAEIRYHGTIHSCTLTDINQDTATIVFEEPLLIANGQSVVVYKDDICLGGGILEK